MTLAYVQVDLHTSQDSMAIGIPHSHFLELALVSAYSIPWRTLHLFPEDLLCNLGCTLRTLQRALWGGGPSGGLTLLHVTSTHMLFFLES